MGKYYLFNGEINFLSYLITLIVFCLIIITIIQSWMIFKVKKKFPIRERIPFIIIFCQIIETKNILLILIFTYLNNGNITTWKKYLGYFLIPIFNATDYCLFIIFYWRYFRIYFWFNYQKIKNNILRKWIKNENYIIGIGMFYYFFVYLLFLFLFNNKTAYKDMNVFIEDRNIDINKIAIFKYSFVYNLKVLIDIFLMNIFKKSKNNFKIQFEIKVNLFWHFVNGWISLIFDLFPVNNDNLNYILLYSSLIVTHLIFLFNTTLWNYKEVKFNFPVLNNWIFSDFNICIFEPKFCKFFDEFLIINYPLIHESFLDFKKDFLKKSFSNNINLDNSLKKFRLYYELYKTTKSYKLLEMDIKNNNTIIYLIYN